jgi:hypothetical protein
MRSIRILLLFSLVGLVSSPRSSATDVVAGKPGITITEAWVRETPPGVTVGALYFTISNATAHADALIVVQTPVGTGAQFHETSMRGGMMQMRSVSSVELPAGSRREFAPGGMHVMLVGLQTPLVAGARLPFTARLRGGSEVRFEATVRSSKTQDIK